MTEAQRWDYLCQLDEELLLGGVIISEWCVFITREADVAFASGAHLATVLLTVSAIETHLRAEHQGGSARLVKLIDSPTLAPQLKADLHSLRKYRNRRVHIDEPWDDQALLHNPEEEEAKLEEFAKLAVRVLRQTIYANPWV